MYNSKLRIAIAFFGLTASLCEAQGNATPTTAGGAAEHAGVQILSIGQMAEEDAALLASRQKEIASAAVLNGYDLGSGTWVRDQVLCPNATRHLIMHYQKLSQDGLLSLFTVVVPRSENAPPPGRARVIPVLYHSTPATHVFGSSPAQRELINEVISTNALGPEPDWKTLALCYAALAGSEPNSKSIAAPEGATPLVVDFTDGKFREMRFSLLGPDHLFEVWRIEFDRQTRVQSIDVSFKPARGAPSAPVGTAATPHPVPQS
jgi:hypothetical protein